MADDEIIILHYTISPEPKFNQIMHGDNLQFNVTLLNNSIRFIPGEPVDPKNGLIKYTGNLIIENKIQWKLQGNYDFGSMTTGYTAILDKVNETRTISYWGLDNISTSFNHTFTKDAFDYGVKPFESLFVTCEASVYYQYYNWSIGYDYPFKGDLVTEKSFKLTLVDETKIDYIEGKLHDFKDELDPLLEMQYTLEFDQEEYIRLLDEMEEKFNTENYVESLKKYQRYDDRKRTDYIHDLIQEINTSLIKAELTQDFLNNVTVLQASYDLLEEKYVTLTDTYQIKLTELDEAKQAITTSITAVFLSSIIFFFIGRYSKKQGKQLQLDNINKTE
jgi:hypothetical protein